MLPFRRAEQQNNATLMLGAYRALAVTRYYLGDFETALQYAMSGFLSSGARAPYSLRLNRSPPRGHLSVLWGTMRVAPCKDRLMPNHNGGSHLLGKGSEGRIRIG
jgi:hypothetical protein